MPLMGKQIQLHAKYDDQQQAQPELRHGIADH